ncbi:MAG: hypothetical protein WEB58_19305 [Planctomycetaceae bacterium]
MKSSKFVRRRAPLALRFASVFGYLISTYQTNYARESSERRPEKNWSSAVIVPFAAQKDKTKGTLRALRRPPIFLSGHLIARWKKALFLGYFVAYTSYRFRVAQSKNGLDE